MAPAKLARINTGLLVLIVAINCYVIALPLLPAAAYRLRVRTGDPVGTLERAIGTPAAALRDAPAGNRLVVPAMLLDEPINEGKTASALKQGIWRRPRTGTPATGSNTVLVAHRLTYDNPRGTFYHLDKVKPGDPIGVWWEGTLHRYVVEEVTVVPADRIEVEAPTGDTRLTLYTCTPLWLPKDRLVVVARPVAEDTQ